jgi:hypothetical protein
MKEYGAEKFFSGKHRPLLHPSNIPLKSNPIWLVLFKIISINLII